LDRAAADLIELMPGRTANGAVGPRPEWPIDELGVVITAHRRAVGQVLGNQLPAIIVGGGKIGVGTLKKWNGGLVPIPVAVVPEGLGVKKLLLVENLRSNRRCAQKQEDQSKDSRIHGAVKII
jgi:hypothetical protein